MQENCMDYYDLGLNGEEGCCLICESAEYGCLCKECKCKICYYYSENETGGGYCDLRKKWQDRKKNKECMKCGTKLDIIKAVRMSRYTRKDENNILMVCPKCQRVLWRKWDWDNLNGRKNGNKCL